MPLGRPGASRRPGYGPDCHFYLQPGRCSLLAPHPQPQPALRLPHLPGCLGVFSDRSLPFPALLLIKARRKVREFLPAQVTPPSQFPTCSALPLRPGQGKQQGARPCPVQLHHPAPDSHMQTDRGLFEDSCWWEMALSLPPSTGQIVLFAPTCHSLEWNAKELQVTDPPPRSL